MASKVERVSMQLPRALKSAFLDLCEERCSGMSVEIRQLMLRELKAHDRVPSGFSTWDITKNAKPKTKSTVSTGR